jgi:hypothetical protein
MAVDQTWGALSSAQRDRLDELGIHATAGALARPGTRPALDAEAAETVEAAGSAPGTRPVVLPRTASTWDKNMAALRQYRAREGHVRVPRGHREIIHIHHGDEDGGAVGSGADGGGELREEYVRLGVFRSNTRTRRDRLTPKQHREAESVGLLD